VRKEYYTQLLKKEGINKVKITKRLFKFIQGFEIALLKSGQQITLRSRDCEVGIVILKGKCNINIDGKTYKNLGSRVDVFSERPTAVYIPLDKEVEILSFGVELALCYARCQKKKEFAIINPSRIKVTQVGKDNWQRQVSLIIGPDSESVNLIVGETINPPGNWSGTPAHKHEVDNLPFESLHEELYYFRVNRKDGFGIQRFYSPERNINEFIYLCENTVTFIPWGYHQIVAGPGYTLYYLFFLSGKSGKLIGFSDPNHKWITE
jgi:5-deoxy-glucuronate isomerase